MSDALARILRRSLAAALSAALLIAAPGPGAWSAWAAGISRGQSPASGLPASLGAAAGSSPILPNAEQPLSTGLAATALTPGLEVGAGVQAAGQGAEASEARPASVDSSPAPLEPLPVDAPASVPSASSDPSVPVPSAEHPATAHASEELRAVSESPAIAGVRHADTAAASLDTLYTGAAPAEDGVGAPTEVVPLSADAAARLKAPSEPELARPFAVPFPAWELGVGAAASAAHLWFMAVAQFQSLTVLGSFALYHAAVWGGAAFLHFVARRGSLRAGPGAIFFPAALLATLLPAAAFFLGLAYPAGDDAYALLSSAWVPVAALVGLVALARRWIGAAASGLQRWRYSIMDLLKVTLSVALASALAHKVLGDMLWVEQSLEAAEALMRERSASVLGGIEWAVRPVELAQAAAETLEMMNGLLAGAWLAFTAWILSPARPWSRAAAVASKPGFLRRFLRGLPVATYTLIGLNVLVAAVAALLPSIEPLFGLDYGHWRGSMGGGAYDPFSPLLGAFSAFAHAFAHMDLDHLIGNLIPLWLFGARLEKHAGRRRFVMIYGIGIAASAFSALFLMGGFLVGASGAISAVTGAYFASYVYGLIRPVPGPVREADPAPIRAPGVSGALTFALAVGGRTLAAAARWSWRALRWGGLSLLALLAIGTFGIDSAYMLGLPIFGEEDVLVAHHAHVFGFLAGAAAAVYLKVILPLRRRAPKAPPPSPQEVVSPPGIEPGSHA